MTDVLDGKIAVVTGASSGLGRAVSEILTRRGAQVFGVARGEEQLRQSMIDVAGAVGEQRYSASDVSDSAQCAAAVQKCVDTLGGIDILVNVAGSHTLRHTAEIADDEWAHDLAVNLNGPFFLSRAALPHLLERGGNIVNVSSIAGLEGQAYSAGYCSAKHGLIGLTRAMAMEFTGKALRVNAICPGGMMTPQVTGFTFPDGVDFDLVMKVASPRGLMEAEDVAKMVAFIASDDASAIHGAVYSVDNGKMA
ncbi:SDR family NAD(P)-dependent oxidoreductase [Rhodococcus sp. OK302]|uniref:SDR family NAD(P)-dependent oxidoreductase n=1 Tax=Rhodococcus sp. OK302 TaxID=1882769 RepID=UPI000B93BB88|nr:SDR family oxidoreductase [Rhodococcus sp. OK302]OYD67965.1 NAD(P)-dependent dehydrogenase (short-subunit alcohol dehydrogenase family) [Rhodococcus sp. OK302]